MFISFSKVLANIGGFRIGIGMRATKNNILWVSIIYLVVVTFQLMWYSMVLAAWLVYAFFYAIYWCIKKLIQLYLAYKEDSETESEPVVDKGN